ncbi:MAG TPA: ROK family protein [Flavisolibacter sp.]|nr:ROK family protein [Flavisolibacter sp.]
MESVIGIDIGGTNIRAGVVKDLAVINSASKKINSKGSKEEVFEELFEVIDAVMDKGIAAIGIGVPSVVDLDSGVAYEVQNIPSWDIVPLKERVEGKYKLPVLVNNDANCFALGEYHFGKGKGYNNMIGLNIGTGLGAGIILNGKLYCGSNCGAGEFGMVPYLDKHTEYYASGQFFRNVYQADGAEVFEKAKAGDKKAIEMFNELGYHLGNAFKTILYTFDPEIIIVGGSLKNAWEFYSDALKQQLNTFVFSRSVLKLHTGISELENCGVLGAAALHFDEIIK